MAVDHDLSPFAPSEWAKKDYTERVRTASQVYLARGLGYRLRDYGFHAAKVVLFVAGWMFFCRWTPGLGTLANFTQWIFEPTAFQKAILWASLVEVTGFGCMSGPLGLKVWPPFTACLHFLRPGTTKLAPFPRLPLFGGTTRSIWDASLYAGLVIALVVCLLQEHVESSYLLAVVVLFVLAGLGDKTIWLAGRVEQHFAMILCFLFAGNWIAGVKWVQLAIWFWAGVSKLTPAFPYVVSIMAANNSLVKSQHMRQRMFVDPPDELGPSRVARTMAFLGGFLEFATPITLLFVTHEGPLLYLGLTFALMLHGFILSNLPIAAVFEWNVLNIYAAFFLFAGHPEVSLFDIGSVPLTIYLLVALVVLPLAGNLFPAWVSFLVSMRYYAGNWAWNAWLFRDESYHKLERLKRAAPLLLEQQSRALPPDEAVRADATLLAFRALHLQGRALGQLLPQAIGPLPFQRFTYADGETVAGSVLGWNFGEGHLADERLLAAIQEQCGFEEGELRVICVEAQPLFGSTLHWRINDAKRGLLSEGYLSIHDLAERKPWDCGPVAANDRGAYG
ncbi:MAG: DUF3556 domain-containing protein [Pirellulales bacterium]|nr:DUF3556 domain-containing protein [Pirellulales bacterium]